MKRKLNIFWEICMLPGELIFIPIIFMIFWTGFFSQKSHLTLESYYQTYEGKEELKLQKIRNLRMDAVSVKVWCEKRKIELEDFINSPDLQAKYKLFINSNTTQIEEIQNSYSGGGIGIGELMLLGSVMPKQFK